MLVTDKTPPKAGAPALTDREMMIVFLMGTGRSSPEIAAMLELSPRTVENRKRLIYNKLGVSSQGQAVAEAIRLGLLQTGRLGTHAPPGPRWQPHPGEPGRVTVAMLMGQAGRPRDEVARLLVSERVPLVIVSKREAILDDYWFSWPRCPVVVVLVDPQPQDWPAAISLSVGIVVVCGRDVPGQLAVADALARGARGVVAEADVSAGGLGPTLAAVAQGMLVVSWSYADAARKWGLTPRLEAPQLTPREREILGLIASGHTVRQTARALGIAIKTVENIQARLFRKLGARNRMDTLTIADAMGLVKRAEDLVHIM
jgi:DNA-binding NarL/FixJ family response regulator